MNYKKYDSWQSENTICFQWHGFVTTHDINKDINAFGFGKLSHAPPVKRYKLQGRCKVWW